MMVIGHRSSVIDLFANLKHEFGARYDTQDKKIMHQSFLHFRWGRNASFVHCSWVPGLT